MKTNKKNKKFSKENPPHGCVKTYQWANVTKLSAKLVRPNLMLTLNITKKPM